VFFISVFLGVPEVFLIYVYLAFKAHTYEEHLRNMFLAERRRRAATISVFLGVA